MNIEIDGGKETAFSPTDSLTNNGLVCLVKSLQDVRTLDDFFRVYEKG